MSDGENETRMVDSYNYADFTGDESQGDFAAFMGAPHVGEKMPDGTLTRLDDGAAVALSSLWREQHLIIEFGSYG
jgi:hypothetical protein